MEIREAFVIDDPAVSVPWGTTTQALEAMITARALRRVTRGYYTLPASVLGGLRCMLGFHFRGADGGLSELEFFRRAYPDRQASFDEFQRYFEQAFGPPARTEAGHEGFPFHEWRPPGVSIVHTVIDRFGPEEHMRIRRTS